MSLLVPEEVAYIQAHDTRCACGHLFLLHSAYECMVCPCVVELPCGCL